MIALDTNVIVRFLVNDDLKQARKAKALVGQLDTKENRAFVSDIVLCELVWVLSSRYGFSRAQITLTLKRLAGARQLELGSSDGVRLAIEAYEKGTGDFADYLIREHARAVGCESVATFDKMLYRDSMFVAP
jgi:predicted nucleic-acid-binding protein